MEIKEIIFENAKNYSFFKYRNSAPKILGTCTFSHLIDFPAREEEDPEGDLEKKSVPPPKKILPFPQSGFGSLRQSFSSFSPLIWPHKVDYSFLPLSSLLHLSLNDIHQMCTLLAKPYFNLVRNVTGIGKYLMQTMGEFESAKPFWYFRFL